MLVEAVGDSQNPLHWVEVTDQSQQVLEESLSLLVGAVCRDMVDFLQVVGIGDLDGAGVLCETQTQSHWGHEVEELCLDNVNGVGKEEDNRARVVMGIRCRPCGCVTGGWKSVAGDDVWSEIGLTYSCTWGEE